MLTAPEKSQLTIGHRPSPVKTGSVLRKTTSSSPVVTIIFERYMEFDVISKDLVVKLQGLSQARSVTAFFVQTA